MNKKIIFGSMLVSLLIVSMPFVSALQATNAPSEMGENVIVEEKSIIITKGLGSGCLMSLAIFSTFVGLAGVYGAAALYNALYLQLIGGEGAVDIDTILEELQDAGAYGVAARLMWDVVKGTCLNFNALQQSSQGLDSNIEVKSGCVLCAL